MNQIPVWLIILFAIVGVIGLLGLILALGALGLAVLAIIDGLRGRNRERSTRFRRLSESESIDHVTLNRIAVKIGFEVTATVPVDLQVAVESLLGKCQVLDLMQRRVRGGTFSLCNVRREEQRRAGGRDNSYTWTLVKLHTMVIFDANGSVDFPPMGVNPKQPGLIFKVLISIGNGIARITKWLGGRWDRSNLLPDNPLIRFPDDPEFHEKLWVGSVVPEAAIPLLGASVREVLKENADLSVTANKQQVIAYDHGSGFQIERPPGRGQELIRSEVLAAEDWPELCRAAVRVINALRKAEASTAPATPFPD